MLIAGCADVSTIGAGRAVAEGIGDTVFVGRDTDIGVTGEPGDDGVGVLTTGWTGVVDTFVDAGIGAGIGEGAGAPVDG